MMVFRCFSGFFDASLGFYNGVAMVFYGFLVFCSGLLCPVLGLVTCS